MMAKHLKRLATLIVVLGPAAVHAQSGSGTSAATNPSPPMALSLSEALRLATGASESIAIARAGEQRARGQQAQARSTLMPQLGTTLNWQKTLQNQFAAISKKSSSGSTSTPKDTSSAASATSSITRIFASEYTTTFGLTASQPLYTGGRATANIKAATLGRESAEIGITAAQAQVQLDVTQAYYDALLSDRLLTISDSSVVQAERTLRQVQLTRNVGSASEFELIRARVTRDNQRPAWLQARTTRELAYVRLRQLLNISEARSLALTDSIVETTATPAPITTGPITTINVNATEVLSIDPAVQARIARTLGAVDTTVSVRAPVRQALKGVEVAQQQLRASRASRLPSISAVSTYQRLAYPTNVLPRSLGDFFPNWTMGVGLSYPFFTGGRVKGDILIAEASVVEAQQRLRLAQEGAALDARASSAKLTEAEAAWQASIGTAEQAQRAYEIAEVRFREGISTQLELSETRVQLQQALANRARAARDLQIARKRLELLRDLPLSSGSNTSTGFTP